MLTVFRGSPHRAQPVEFRRGRFCKRPDHLSAMPQRRLHVCVLGGGRRPGGTQKHGTGVCVHASGACVRVCVCAWTALESAPIENNEDSPHPARRGRSPT